MITAPKLQRLAFSLSPRHPYPRWKRCPSSPSRRCYSQSPMVGCPACTEPFLIALSNLRRLKRIASAAFPAAQQNSSLLIGRRRRLQYGRNGDTSFRECEWRNTIKHETEGNDITYLDHCNGMHWKEIQRRMWWEKINRSTYFNILFGAYLEDIFPSACGNSEITDAGRTWAMSHKMKYS